MEVYTVTTFDWLISLALILVSLPLLFAWVQNFSLREKKWVGLAFIANIFATIAIVWVHTDFYGYGDMLSFHRVGEYLADMLRQQFATAAPDLLNILVHREPSASIRIHGIGTSTGTMYALAGFLNYFLYDSLYGICFVASLTAFFGLLAMYSGLRTGLSETLKVRVLFACLLIPSVVFWSSGLIKESIAIAGLGFATQALYQTFYHRHFLRGGLLLALGAALMAMSKGFLLMPFAAGASLWMVIYFARRSGRNLSAFSNPAYAILGLILALLSVFVIGELFPRYSIANLAAEVAHLQEVGARTEGESNFAFIDAPDEMTLMHQLVYAPMAIITALFRPFIFEAHNPFALMAALEVMAAMIFFGLAIYKQGFRKAWNRVLNSPTLIYCLAVVFILSFGVGLTTTNMGTLSRYRIPMMPMYLTLVLLLLPVDSSTPSKPPRS